MSVGAYRAERVIKNWERGQIEHRCPNCNVKISQPARLASCYAELKAHVEHHYAGCIRHNRYHDARIRCAYRQEANHA
jgi:hypothetical protein